MSENSPFEEFTQVAVERHDRVGVIRMNRPQYRNAQSRVMREELDIAFAELGHDEEISVIVLLGAGDHFSGGHDLGTPEEKADREVRPFPTTYPGRYDRMWELNVANTLRWRDVPKPTIAGVQGYCIFAGWLVASAMDVIVASEDALFLPEFVQYFTMPWDVGARKTKEILFEGRFVTAQEAHELGFVNRVVPRDELESHVLDLAARFAETDPFRLRHVKQVVNGILDMQGMRSSIDMAFLRYYHLHEAERIESDGQMLDPGRERPRRPRAARAFERLQEQRAAEERANG